MRPSRLSFNLQSPLAAMLVLPISLSATVDKMPAAAVSTPSQTTSQTAKLQGDEKLLQVLNRFTYGPRPGDLEKIRALGVQAWFNQQLAPQKIDDSLLDKKLASYPAMQMPLKQLMEAYPNQQTIRKEMNGRAERPDGEAEKAIYNDAIARYKDKLAKKNAGAATKTSRTTVASG